MRLREYHRADVAPFHYHASASREGALHLDELGTHFRQARDLRCGQRHFRRAQARGDVVAVDQHARFAVAGRHLHIGRADQLGHGGLIMGINAGLQYLERRRAVCGPTIDIHQSQAGGELLRHRAFSRARRAVNRDYQGLGISVVIGVWSIGDL